MIVVCQNTPTPGWAEMPESRRALVMIADQQGQIVGLQKEVAALQEKLGTNSSNSSTLWNRCFKNCPNSSSKCYGF